MDISIIGGTGDEGFGLTLRLARAGHHVTIGSRSQEKGAASAEKARELVGGDANVDGTTNEAAAAAEVVIVTVPFEGQAETYRSIKGAIEPGTIVVDCTSPLATAVGGRAWHVVRPWHGSAAEQAKAILELPAFGWWGRSTRSRARRCRTSSTRWRATCWSAAPTRRPRRSSAA